MRLLRPVPPAYRLHTSLQASRSSSGRTREKTIMIHRLPNACVPYQRERSKLRALLTPIAWATLTLAATACGAVNDGAADESVDSENVASASSTEQALTAADIDATKSLLITDVDV